MKPRQTDIWGGARQESDPEIRVTDRRRSYLDDEAPVESGTETPNLKPRYVEELEARTHAAEKVAQDVQMRFEELKTRLQQETDATRQRLNRAADERAERGKADFIAGLLPVLDNLERATGAAVSGSTPEQVLAGVQQTAESFRNALAAAGVEPVKAAGELFDPELHEAVDTVAADPELDGRVVTEYSPGYRMGERLLRPARVKVARAAERSRGAID